MNLSDEEKAELERLKAKQEQGYSDRWLESIQRRVKDLYNYRQAFSALKIWQEHADRLAEVIRDNRALVDEVNRLKVYEKRVAELEGPSSEKSG